MQFGCLIFKSVGFAILPLAFLLSLPLSHGIFYVADYHTLITLETDPNSYVEFTWRQILLGILPIAMSLTFLTIAYLKEKETPTEDNGFGHWLFVLVGGFCILWGLLFVIGAFSGYFDIVNRLAIIDIDVFLLVIYSTYGLVGVLWMTTGIFLVIAFVSRTHE